MPNWQPIKTAPVGETVLLCNATTGHVVVGYGEWFSAPMPRWVSVDPEGFGRFSFKATHWMPLPAAASLIEEAT